MRRIDTIIRNSRLLKQTRRSLVFLIAVALLGIGAAPGGMVVRSALATTVVQTPTALPDAFAYDINAGKLFQLTNTPVNEVLSDISVCNGLARIVYAAPFLDFDVFAFTFEPPSPTASQIEDLIELVESFNLPQGIENSLITKLRDALAAIEVSDTTTACNALTAFVSESQAQSGKKLTADRVGELVNSANQIKTDLGCQ